MAKKVERRDFFERPDDSKVRQREFENLLPCGREKFRLLGLEGKAPKPERFGDRMALYRVGDVKRFIGDPANYCESGSSISGIIIHITPAEQAGFVMLQTDESEPAALVNRRDLRKVLLKRIDSAIPDQSSPA